MKSSLFFLFVMMTITINAQRFHGGIVAGFNASQIDGDLWGGYHKAGLMGGAFVNTKFTSNWGAQMEIRYTEKGSATSKYQAFQRRFRLQYFEIPVLVRYYPIQQLDLQWGLAFGYLYDIGQDDGDGYYSILEEQSRSEISLCAGVNYALFKRLDVNARFSYSLLPVWESYSGATYGNGQAWFNNVITFGFYYHIGGRAE